MKITEPLLSFRALHTYISSGFVSMATLPVGLLAQSTWACMGHLITEWWPWASQVFRIFFERNQIVIKAGKKVPSVASFLFLSNILPSGNQVIIFGGNLRDTEKITKKNITVSHLACHAEIATSTFVKDPSGLLSLHEHVVILKNTV